jgi:acyl-homoserine-lactone acylase
MKGGFPRLNLHLVHPCLLQSSPERMKRIYPLLLGILALLPFQLAAQQSPNYTYQKGSVEIVRDKWGVPHIYGKTDADVAYGLSYAQCEDDFVTLQRTLAMAKGYSGVVDGGVNGVVVDFFLHFLKVPQKVAAAYDSQVSPAGKRYLEAFCAGANHFAKLHPKEVMHAGLFPVKPQDVLQGYMLASNLFNWTPLILEAIFKGKADKYRINLVIGGGSNGFALNSKKTADGKVYLAVNSHQPLEGPFSWYETHMVSGEGLDIMGGTFPGGMTIFHGFNKNLGWANTTNYNDFVDWYKLTINPKNKNQYWFDGRWVDLDPNPIKLKVRFGKLVIGVTKQAYYSVYGPTLRTKKGVYAIRSGAIDRMVSIDFLLGLNKANTLAEFKKCLEMQQFSSMNYVYADRFDNIFYVSNGLYPDRDPNFDWRYVMRGDTSATLWTKLKPFSECPQVENPPAGYVFNTNNSPLTCTGGDGNPPASKYDKTMNIIVHNNMRGIQSQNLLDNDRKVDWTEFKRIKFFQTYPSQGRFFDSLAVFLKAKPEDYPDIAEGLRVIQKWDRNTHMDNLQAGFILKMFRHLFDKLQAGLVESEEGMSVSPELMHETVAYTMKWMKKHYNGRLEVPLGEIQRHTRGKVDLPIGGLPDVLAAILSDPMKDKKHKGKYRAVAGESYITLVKFGKDGPELIESINAYGSSNRPESPHYTDQMEMYTKQQLRPMTMDKATIYRDAEKIYQPE